MINTIFLPVEEAEIGTRIDKFISDKAQRFSRSAAAKLLESGAVTVNEKAVTKNYKCKAGDRVVILVPKGAHGAYAEPFTYYNGGDAKGGKYSSGVNRSVNLWNGSYDASHGIEYEWIGQRGSKFRVVKKTGSTIYLQLIGQYYEQTSNPSSYF